MIIQQDVKELLNAAPVEVLNLLSVTWNIGIPVKNGKVEGLIEANKCESVHELLEIEREKVRQLKRENEELLREIQLIMFDGGSIDEKLFLLWNKYKGGA